MLLKNIYYKSKRILLFSIIVLLLIYFIEIFAIVSYPTQINVLKGQNKSLNIIFPFTIDILNNDNIIDVNNSLNQKISLGLKKTYKFNTIDNGIASVELKLLNLIPIKNIQVNVLDNIYLMPGGNSIGVKLNTKGVLVVALSEICDVNGNKVSPAKDAGIKAGDIIISINGEKIVDADHVVKILNSIKDNKVEVEVQRNKINFSTFVTPVKCKEDNFYRLGVWVRDKIAGIGTLTFYDENTNKFGALGHGITDIDTGSLLEIEDGKIMKARVSSIEVGQKGKPGEIRGIFFETEDTLGEIEKNSVFGIYGNMNAKIEYNKMLPIALQNEVKVGKAYILTTIEDDSIDKYEIEIIKVNNQKEADQKSMVIKITDDRLLKKTGGIVQGMSGSPIIQNGKIVGAITHVFVNDPTKGYGIYIEWMLKEAGISINTKNRM